MVGLLGDLGTEWPQYEANARAAMRPYFDAVCCGMGVDTPNGCVWMAIFLHVIPSKEGIQKRQPRYGMPYSFTSSAPCPKA